MWLILISQVYSSPQLQRSQACRQDRPLTQAFTAELQPANAKSWCCEKRLNLWTNDLGDGWTTQTKAPVLTLHWDTKNCRRWHGLKKRDFLTRCSNYRLIIQIYTNCLYWSSTDIRPGWVIIRLHFHERRIYTEWIILTYTIMMNLGSTFSRLHCLKNGIQENRHCICAHLQKTPLTWGTQADRIGGFEHGDVRYCLMLQEAIGRENKPLEH